HSVVSRFEALKRAKMLKLDLVEVDKNANPPVCKIMDYHKELYKKKESDKERAKSKVLYAMINAVVTKCCCEVSLTAFGFKPMLRVFLLVILIRQC
ncbi:translation initiation factor IF-3 chloroplastic-like, partial [Trifolium medium]|nr:translation initiation factor IF-3 chloroplastic-like [Trifolium medium]